VSPFLWGKFRSLFAGPRKCGKSKQQAHAANDGDFFGHPKEKQRFRFDDGAAGA
jgi:hypothetical protein